MKPKNKPVGTAKTVVEKKTKKRAIPTGKNEDAEMDKIPFAVSASTPRYYDSLVPDLMLKVGKTKKQFFVTYTDKVLGGHKQAFVAAWGDLVENKTQRGVEKMLPITLQQIRQQALKMQSDIVSTVRKGKSPVVEAQRQLEAEKREADQTMTLRFAFDHYCKMNSGLKGPTIAEMESTFRNHCKDVLDKPLKSWCTPEFIERRFIDIYTHNSQFGHGGSKTMGHKFLTNLRSVLNYVDARKELLGENPVDIADRLFRLREKHPKPPRKKTIIRSADRFILHHKLRMLDEQQDYLAADFIRLILYTGLRDEAARTLRWQLENLQKGFLRIFLDSDRDRTIILPIADCVIDLLLARRERLKEHNEYFEIARSGWVFPTKNDGQWGFLKESKKFYERLDMPTTTPMVLRDKHRFPVLDGKDSIPIKHPENADIAIWKRATSQDLRRVVASWGKNRVGIPKTGIARMLTHSDTEDVTEGYIVDEHDERIELMRAHFNALAEFIDEEKEVPPERAAELLKDQRLTVSALPSGKAPTAPLVRNKHTPKTKPTHKTTSHP